jgi:ABC-2 type transport system permease protein
VNAGLLYLMRRGVLGRLRMLRRRLGSVKGALGLLALAGFLALIALPHLLGGGEMRAVVDPSRVDFSVRTFGPVLFLGTVSLTVFSGRALTFTPSEIDFLFAAPVSRRELLVYAMLSRSGLDVLSGLWFGIFVSAYAGTRVGGFAATTLLMVLAGVCAQAYTVAGLAARARWGAARWWGAHAAAAVLLAAGLAGSVLGARGAGGLRATVQAVVDGAFLRAVTLPVRPLVELYLAVPPLAVAAWAAASLALIAAAGAAVVRIDVHYAEHAIEVSRRRAERLRRMQSGGAAAGRGGFRPRVPELRLLGAAAPLARRQLLELSRNPRTLLGPALVIAFILVPVVLLPAIGGGALREDLRALALPALAVVVAAPLLMPQLVPFDFRRDLDRLAYLRSLPLSPAAVAVGQLTAPALGLVTVQAVGIVAIALATGGVAPLLLVSLLLLVPPLTWAAVAADNAAFLLLPHRVAADGSASIQFMGKMWFVMIVKLAVLVAAMLPAAAAAALLHFAAAAPPALAALAAALLLALACVPLTRGVGRVFHRFDLVHDMPA